jgi:hypothetical protein
VCGLISMSSARAKVWLTPEMPQHFDHDKNKKENAMPLQPIRAVFMRGGTSTAIMFRSGDLPAERARWAQIFLAAMGSPDPNGRQLDGMGGGVSSLSKVCVVGPVCTENLNPDVVMVKSAKYRVRTDDSGPLNRANSRRVFAQRSMRSDVVINSVRKIAGFDADAPRPRQ